MRARRSVWADEKVQELLTEFVTVADEVGRLQRGGNPESDVFRGFCEQGHYGGRSRPTGTRQGIYAVAPSGRFLASVNTTSARRMAKMLETALRRWRQLAPEERGLDDERREAIAGTERFEDRYPEDGLVLAQYSRDLGPLPDETARQADWRRVAWNEDQVWFTAREARALLPASLEVGARRDVPHRLVSRLARLHLVDSVRGQTPAFRKHHVIGAELHCDVVAVTGDTVAVRYTGQTLTRQQGRWRTHDGGGEPDEQERGMHTELSGRASWNRTAGRFESFELLAIGERWGATQYNGRPLVDEPTPIGFAFVLAPPGHPRVAPAFWWHYVLR